MIRAGYRPMWPLTLTSLFEAFLAPGLSNSNFATLVQHVP